MDKTGILIYLGGVITGAFVSLYAMDEHYEKLYNEKLLAVKKNYAEFEKKLKAIEAKKDYKSESTDSNTGRTTVNVLPKEERVNIKENWKIKDGIYLDYTQFYKQKNSEAFVIKEPEKAINTVTEESNIDIANFSEETRRTSMPPKIATEREVEMLPEEYNTIDMIYYVYSDTLVIANDERWEVLKDPTVMIGDNLTKYGFDYNEQDVLLVINYQRKESYRIVKRWANYSA